MKNERSVSVSTAASSTGAKKLGQPVPDSNLVSDRNSGGAAAGAAVGPGPVLVPQLAGEGALGALLAKDAVLLGGEFGTPFGVGPGLGGRALGLMHAPMMHPMCGALMTSRRHAHGRPVVHDPDAGWSRQAESTARRLHTRLDRRSYNRVRPPAPGALERRNRSPRASPPDPARHRTYRPSPPRRGRSVGGPPGTRPGVQPATPAGPLVPHPVAHRPGRRVRRRADAVADPSGGLGDRPGRPRHAADAQPRAPRLAAHLGRPGVPRHAAGRPDRQARGRRPGGDHRRGDRAARPGVALRRHPRRARSARSSRAASSAPPPTAPRRPRPGPASPSGSTSSSSASTRPRSGRPS